MMKFRENGILEIFENKKHISEVRMNPQDSLFTGQNSKFYRTSTIVVR